MNDILKSFYGQFNILSLFPSHLRDKEKLPLDLHWSLLDKNVS